MYLGTVWSSTIPATNLKFAKFVSDKQKKVLIFLTANARYLQSSEIT